MYNEIDQKIPHFTFDIETHLRQQQMQYRFRLQFPEDVLLERKRVQNETLPNTRFELSTRIITIRTRNFWAAFDRLSVRNRLHFGQLRRLHHDPLRSADLEILSQRGNGIFKCDSFLLVVNKEHPLLFSEGPAEALENADR